MVSHPAATDLASAGVLPRADAATVRALNRLYARAAPLSLHVQGHVYRVLWEFEARVPEVSYCYRFVLGRELGYLHLDLAAQATLLADRQAHALPRELRYLLLADALAPWIDRLEAACAQRFEWTPPDALIEGPAWSVMKGACFRLRRETNHPDGSGCIQFEDHAVLPTLVAALKLGPVHTRHAFDALRVPLSFMVGRTQIRLHEVRTISPGDIIGIESWHSSGAALRVTASIGAGTGPELVALAEGSRITVQTLKDPDMTPNLHPPLDSDDESHAGNLPLDRLDAMEVTLRFEVGELPVLLGELRGVRAGHVFELPQELNRSTVRILAHGNVLGRGHLVAVGDRLGVRVSEFAPSEL